MSRHTCHELGVCQHRTPACSDCTEQAYPSTAATTSRAAAGLLPFLVLLLAAACACAIAIGSPQGAAP